MTAAAVLIAVMAVTTIALRCLPFLLFGKQTPGYITYLGRVLPQAIIGFLVIYCLKDITVTKSPFGIPEIISAVSVAAVQIWKRNAVLSILSGTFIYMVIIRLMA